MSQEVIGGAPNGIAFSPDQKKIYVVATGVESDRVTVLLGR